MMPTEFVASTVAMLTNTLTEPFDFLNQLLPPHVNKIFVHTSLPELLPIALQLCPSFNVK